MKSIKKILLPLFTYFILLTSCEPATSSSLGESSDNGSNDISTSIGGSEDNDSSVEDSNGSDSSSQTQGGDEIGRTKPFDPTTEVAIEFIDTHENEYAVKDGIYYSGNSYNIGAEVNSYKWDDKIKNLDFFETYKRMIDLRLNSTVGAAYRINNELEASENFGIWQDPIPAMSYSAIATQNKYLTSDSNYGSSKAIYNLYTARLTDDNNKVDEQVFNWGDGEVVVLFNSENLLTGQTISAPLSLESHRLVIVQHH